MTGSSDELSCSFCGKSQRDVERLIAGPPPLHICDGCVTLFVDIIAEESPKWRDKQIRRLSQKPRRRPLSATLTPERRGQ